MTENTVVELTDVEREKCSELSRRLIQTAGSIEEAQEWVDAWSETATPVPAVAETHHKAYIDTMALIAEKVTDIATANDLYTFLSYRWQAIENGDYDPRNLALCDMSTLLAAATKIDNDLVAADEDEAAAK